MKKIELGQAITIVANAAVIVGIVFLGIEIRLSTQATRAEMVSTYQDRWIAIDLSWQSEDFATAWAKSMESPEELTTAEMIQLSGFLYSFIDQLGASDLLWELDVFREPLATPEDTIRYNADIFFGTRFAQAWWAEMKSMSAVDEEIVPLIDEEIAGADQANFDFYERIRSRLTR